MSADPWTDLTAELATLIPQLRNGDTIILESGERYVQLRQGPETVTAEAVANRFLSPQHQLTAQDEQHLTQLRWQPPQPPQRHNWWRDHPWPLRSQEVMDLATTLVATLRDVFQVSQPSELGRRSFNG